VDLEEVLLKAEDGVEALRNLGSPEMVLGEKRNGRGR